MQRFLLERYLFRKFSMENSFYLTDLHEFSCNDFQELLRKFIHKLAYENSERFSQKIILSEFGKEFLHSRFQNFGTIFPEISSIKLAKTNHNALEMLMNHFTLTFLKMPGRTHLGVSSRFSLCLQGFFLERFNTYLKR